MNKNIFTVLVLIFTLILLVAMFGGNSSVAIDSEGRTMGESVVDGDKQIVSIVAKGGYSPDVILAKAGIPTIVRVETSGTFDCSSSLVFPQFNIAKRLPITGTTDIDLPPQNAGDTVQGLCSMGMYSFEIRYL